MAGAYTGILEASFQATTAITKMRFVKHSAEQTVAAITASTDRAVGVAGVDVSAAEFAAGKELKVQVLGVAWVEAGAAVTLGARVMPDTSGRAIAAATATNIPCGVAYSAAANAGDLMLVLLTPGMPPL